MNPNTVFQFLTELGQNVDRLILDERQENRTFSVHLHLVLLEYHHVEIPYAILDLTIKYLQRFYSKHHVVNLLLPEYLEELVFVPVILHHVDDVGTLFIIRFENCRKPSI